MKTHKQVLTLLLTLPVLALAYPGIGGGRGLFRVQNPLVENEAGLSISLHALGHYSTFGDRYWPNQEFAADLIAPELNYAPLATKYVGLELFGSFGGVFQYADLKSDEKTGRVFDVGAHDLKAGAKLSVPIIPVLKLGGMASMNFLPRSIDREWLDPFAVPQTERWGLSWSGLASLHFQDIAKSLPNIMLNYGKVPVASPDMDAVIDYTAYGAGLELAAKGFALFVEAQSLQPPNSSGIFSYEDGGHVRITPGVAFGKATSGLTFKLGYTIAPATYDADEFVLGLSLATPFGRRLPPEIGTIVATVTDARTGAALAANVAFPENPKLKPLTSDPVTGVFKVENVKAGIVVVDVSLDGYQRQSVPINVSGDGVSQFEFKLRPLVTYGVIAGSVVDARTRQPIAARIEVPGTEVAAVSADPATGAFKLENVPVGVYTVSASAPDYYPGSQTVAVEEDRVANAPFELVSSTVARVLLSGKVSDKSSGAALPATISFMGAAPDLSVDGVTGVYSTELPPGPYTVKVSAAGYLDQTAALIIEEGKPQIRNFEMVKEGMTITLKGIFFDVNKTTIKPESRAALADAAKILTDNPTIRVEIQGHTDSQGSAEYNLRLSEGRAAAVVAYLVQNHGIAASRLTARGYGLTMPIADNSTPEGRALNRRVEFVILGQ